MKCFEPDFKFKNMESIDFDELKNAGTKGIILDIDNTLVEPHTPVADDRAKMFVQKLKNAEFKICIVSNNIPQRAKKFADSLNLDWVCNGNKPSKKPFKLALKILKEKPEHIAVVGDQIFTDVWGAKRMKMISVLLDPICDKEGKFVKFKRRIEKIVVNR